MIPSFCSVIDFLQSYNGAVTAIATTFIAAFTIVLAFVTGRQARLTRESIELANKEFAATHRPRIVVRTVWLSEKGVRGTEALIDLGAANAGESEAQITSFIAFPYIQRSDAAFVPKFQDGTEKKPSGLTIKPGQTVMIRATARSIDIEYDWFLHEGARSFIVGRIEYVGPDKISRTMGFCREWKRGPGMWEIVKDSVYEYA